MSRRTATRETVADATSVGVSAQRSDQAMKEKVRIRRPPNLCAAQLPGICEVAYP